MADLTWAFLSYCCLTRGVGCLRAFWTLTTVSSVPAYKRKVLAPYCADRCITTQICLPIFPFDIWEYSAASNPLWISFQNMMKYYMLQIVPIIMNKLCYCLLMMISQWWVRNLERFGIPMVSQSLHHSGLELKLRNMKEFAEGRIKMKLWQTSFICHDLPIWHNREKTEFWKDFHKLPNPGSEGSRLLHQTYLYHNDKNSLFIRPCLLAYWYCRFKMKMFQHQFQHRTVNCNLAMN